MALSGSFTSSWQQRVLDALANNNVVDTALDGLKVGLFTADPGEAGSISNEISGNGYARQALTFGAATNNASNHAEVANTNALAFPASGGSWTGVSHAGVFRTKSFTRTIPSAADALQRLEVPASHCSVVATLTVTDSEADPSDQDTILNVTSNTAGTYNGTDPLGNANYFVRVKTGPLAGMCYDIGGDGTNTIELQNHYTFLAEDINGQQIQILEKPTLEQFFGTIPTYVSGNTTITLASGVTAGQSGAADRLYIVDSSQVVQILYPQHAPTFVGGDGWRALGSAQTEYKTSRLFPSELVSQWDNLSNTTTGTLTDDYQLLRTSADSSVETARGGSSGTWTLTSQVSTTDEMVARFQFEDGSGNAQTHNVADGDQLNISAGDLKLSLN